MTEPAVDTMSEKSFPFKLLAARETGATAHTQVFTRRDYEVCTVEYVCSGAGLLTVNNRSYSPQQDSVYLLPRHSNHTYLPDRNNPWRKLFFVVDGGMVDYLLEAYRLDTVYYLPRCPTLRKFFDEMLAVEIHSPYADRQAALIFHQFAEEAARIAHGIHAALPLDIERLKRAMDESGDGGFSLKRYAAAHNCSEAHLIRSFRRALGTTPYDYLMRKRIETAKRLLLYSSLSVKEIAAQLAFADQYYFSNFFKRKTEISPSDFRSRFSGAEARRASDRTDLPAECRRSSTGPLPRSANIDE